MSERERRLSAADVLAAARGGDADEARRLVSTWLEAHPDPVGELAAERVCNWVAAITLLPELDSQPLEQAVRETLRSLSGLRGVRNARALVLGGAACGDARLVRQGVDLLRRELPTEVLDDGGRVDRSREEQRAVVRMLGEIHAVSPHAWLLDAIERGRRFVAALARPGEADVPDGLSVFPSSGIVVARDGPLWLLFRCGGRVAPLSFELCWEGVPVVERTTVDTGRRGRQAAASLRYAREHALEAGLDLPGRARHIRRIEWDGRREILVLDSFAGRGSRTIESRLLLAPSPPPLELAVEGGTVSVEAEGAAVAHVIRGDLRLPAQLAFRLSVGGEGSGSTMPA